MSPLRIFRRRRRELVCRQVVSLLTDYLDGALPRDTNEKLEAHLAACPHCTEFLHQLRETIDAAQHVEPEAIDDATKDELLDMFRRFRSA